MKGERQLDGLATKKPYRKPELSRVALRPDETVLGNCKITGYVGPLVSGCSTPVCFTLGS